MPGTGDLIMNKRQKSLPSWSVIKPLEPTEGVFKIKTPFII